jgi:hypothetical protein
MNFTSYESGFGVGSRGNSAIGQGAPQQANSNLVGKSNRLFPNQFEQGANMRGTVAGQGANSALLKQQPVNPMTASTIYGNMSNQASMQKAVKNPTSTSQQKFLSKSPNPQSKMMANPNYGKFKGMNMNPNGQVANPQLNQNAVYARGTGPIATANQTNGQYLPKLGHNGMNNAAMANSHAQLPQFNQQPGMVAATHAGSAMNVHQPVHMNYQQQLMQ